MDDEEIYQQALKLSQAAFARKQFKVAYHALACAMYCAVDMRNAVKLEEVERLATEQWQQLQAHFDTRPPLEEPYELMLYSSLKQIAKTQAVLLRSRSSR